MHRPAGIVLIGVGTLLGVMGAFPLRTRTRATAVVLALAIAGVAVGAGALLVQRRTPTPAEWTATLGALAVWCPVHFRVLLGPFGSRAAS